MAHLRLVRAIPPQTKPLPMERFQVVQSFLCTVPQGRTVVEEVSGGAGSRAGRGAVPALSGAFSLLPACCLVEPVSSPIQVDRAITACAELHDLKEVVLEHQRQLEGVRGMAQVRPGEAAREPPPPGSPAARLAQGRDLFL